MKVKNIDEILEELRIVADSLLPISYPKNSLSNEAKFNPFRTRLVTVDGFKFFICFNRSDYGNYYQETFQIFSQKASFVPFNIACKLAQKSLGSHELSLMKINSSSREILIWSVKLDNHGRPLKNKGKKNSYQGFEYYIADPKNFKVF